MIRIHDALDPLLEPIHGVKRHPENAWQGDVDAIVESMQANGVYRPIIVQASTSYILAGNHTWEALLHENQRLAPILRIDVDDTTARRILLADNRTAQRGRYDEADLVSLLRQADQTPAGLTGTGWEAAELEALRRANAEPFRAADFAPRHTGSRTCPRCGYDGG
jgi:ParB-like chromosome segregation protein Spo0J